MLFAVSSKEEVKHAVFSMNPHSAPGLDGFISLFYCSCWHIVCSDVVRVIVIIF